MTTETAIMKLEQIDPEKLKLIKSTIAKDCTDTELSLLLYQADRLKLDPLQRQIWAVKYANKPALIFVGRDGYLVVAHKSGQFDGMDTTIEGEGDNAVATTKVYRKDMSHPIVVSVKMKEYNKHVGTWVEMPETMLKKVSQAQALRQAFAISGVYSPEEVDTFSGTVVDITPDPLHTKEEAQWIKEAKAKEAKKKQTIIEA